jgi:hypothetical protein
MKPRNPSNCERMKRTVKSILQKKIETVNWVILGISVILSFIFVSEAFALGVLFGGLISIANFYWLSRDLVNLFQRLSDTAQPRRFVMTRYFLRLFVTGLVLFFIVTQVPVSVIGLILGLSIVVIGVVLTVVTENVKNSLRRRFKGKNASLVIFR